VEVVPLAFIHSIYMPACLEGRWRWLTEHITHIRHRHTHRERDRGGERERETERQTNDIDVIEAGTEMIDSTQVVCEVRCRSRIVDVVKD
jgi:hypothetical protein